MQTNVRISLVVVQVVTVINTVFGSPIWNNLKGSPPIFLRPEVLPASFSHSTLSNELLNMLKQSRPNYLASNQPSQTCVSQPAAPIVANPPPSSPASVVPSSVLENLLTSYDKKSSPTAESQDGLSGTTVVPVFTSTPADRPDQPSCGVNSQLDRPPSNFDNCSQPVATASQEPDKNPDPTLTQVMGSFMLPPAETPLPEQTPRPDVSLQTNCPPTPCSAPETTVATTSSAASPFPGSTLVSIQPLNLPPKFSQELVKMLSDSVQSGSSQGPTQNPSFVPCTLPPSSAPPPAAETSPLLPSDPALTLLPSDSTVPCPKTVSQPLPPVPMTPSQQARQLLNHLLVNSPSTVQKLKSLVCCYSTPTTNPISVPADSPSYPQSQPSTFNPCNLNLDFIKYLSTIPRNQNPQ